MTVNSVNGMRLRAVFGRADWHPPRPFGPDGWAMLRRDRTSSVIVSCDLQGGDEWVHASIAHDDRMPTYEDLTQLHRAVFGDGWAYQVFAPPTEHVNIHEYALHLFGRLDGKPALPDFTDGMGTI